MSTVDVKTLATRTSIEIINNPSNKVGFPDSIKETSDKKLFLIYLAYNLLSHLNKTTFKTTEEIKNKEALQKRMKDILTILIDLLAKENELAGGAKKKQAKKSRVTRGGGVAANAADVTNFTGLLRAVNDPITQAASPSIIALTRQDPPVTAGMTGLGALDVTSDFPESVTNDIVHNLGGIHLS